MDFSETTHLIKDFQSLPEEHYKNLPPLVAMGADRQSILKEVINEWACQPITEEEALDTTMTFPSSLVNLDIRDDNPDALPIDFGADLLQPLSQMIQGRLPESADGISRKIAESRPLTSGMVSLFGCRIDGMTCSGLDIPFGIIIVGSQIDGKVSCERATFRSITRFDCSKFTADTEFNDSEFHSNSNFSFVSMFRKAQFTGATFKGYSSWNNALFHDRTNFTAVQFERPAKFQDAKFKGELSFANVACHGGVSFSGVTFAHKAGFTEAKFRSTLNLSRATFQDEVCFKAAVLECACDIESCSFLGPISFASAEVITLVEGFPLSGLPASTSFHKCDLRRAHVKNESIPLSDAPSGRWLPVQKSDMVNWHWVRKVGELTALTRVSYFALVGVPLLAGVWGGARSWITRQNGALQDTRDTLVNLLRESGAVDAQLTDLVNELATATLPATMPSGWLMAFLAAFFVVLAQLVYQVWAPETVRESSEDELVERANLINREHQGISPERLRQAIDFLHTSADKMPHRHSPWFVTRGQRTVWLPDDADYLYEDAEVQILIHEELEDTRLVKATDQEVDGEDRKRIAIEEGQKAHFAVAAFEQRSAAWMSGGLYLLAGFLSLAVVLRQLGHVLAASSATWLSPAFFVLTNGWLIAALGVAILAITILGTWTVRNDG